MIPGDRPPPAATTAFAAGILVLSYVITRRKQELLAGPRLGMTPLPSRLFPTPPGALSWSHAVVGLN